MKAKQLVYVLVILTAGLAGCAYLQTPSADLVSKVPVVKVGQPEPQGGDYILLIPAGKDIPVNLTVGGSFLSGEGTSVATVQVRHDVYIYKLWSSLDGKHWERGVFQILLSAGMGPKGGEVHLDVNRPG